MGTTRRTIAAGMFKARCLKLLDEVAPKRLVPAGDRCAVRRDVPVRRLLATCPLAQDVRPEPGELADVCGQVA